MVQITLRVHPLSKRILLAEYGAEPLRFPSHDFIFKMLATAPFTSRPRRSVDRLSDEVEIQVDARLGRHLSDHGTAAALNLLAYHQTMICRHADSALKIEGRGSVKRSIEGFLSLYRVDENEYASETAYKLWQRHNWKIAGKNGHFFAAKRDKSAVKCGKVSRRSIAHQPLLSFADAQSLAEAIIRAHQTTFKSTPGYLLRQIAMYLFVTANGYSAYTAARLLNVPARTARHAVAKTRQRFNNPTFAKIVGEGLNCALPNASHGSTPLLHATAAPHHREIMPPRPPRAEGDLSDRASRPGYRPERGRHSAQRP